MSKLSFRARALDAAKPLPVYRNRDLPDLGDCVSINRTVPQMPTGMEKEEESEHHLQRAISAQQVFREKKENMVIPVPEAESNVTYYDRLYKGEFRIPKQLIHIQPLSLDNEQPDYDMDSEDETLLNRINRKMELKPIQFETMVDRLEKASTNQIVSFQEAKLLLNEDDYLLKSVYDYWVRKRKNCRGPSLIPQVKQEKRDGSTNNDPYVAFRRRTEKMQTRKNRKNDEASYEKMLKLRREFSRTITILEMIKRREKSKRELLHLTLEVVEKRYQLGDFGGEILNEVTVPRTEKSICNTPVSLPNGNHHKIERKVKVIPHHISVKDELHFDFVRPKKKYPKKVKLDTFAQPRTDRQSAINKCDIKQYDFHSSGEEDYPQVQSPLSEPDEETDPDGHFAFRRKAECQYQAPLEEQHCSVLWHHPELAGLEALHHRHCLTVLSVPPRCVGLARRRVGRGGRVILDRASSEHDHFLKQLELDASVSGASSRSSDITDTSRFTSASRALPGRAGSLQDILSNIKACRWKLFRPQPKAPKDNEHESETSKAGPAVNAGLSAATVTLLNTSKNGISGCITEQQFQNHQQQLVQMQKQQLAQLQQTQPSERPAQPRHPSTQDNNGKNVPVKQLLRDIRHFLPDVRNLIVSPLGTSKPFHTTSVTLSNGQVQLLRTVPSSVGVSGGSSQLLPTLYTASHQSLPGPGTTHLSGVTVVSPVHLPLGVRNSAPSPSALKLATVATTLDRVAKVTPSSAIGSLSRETNEPERLALNGISETTVAMEVT
uniref:Enhancer of polycomb homolog n=1 Tax=Scleropages formosus TaxID=113540 RepID=A0A8C9SFI7_SCLFO